METNYWSERWQQGNTPWDMGSCSPPLTAYLQGLYNKEQHILIPGAGNGYELIWLWKNGFKNARVIDIALEPLENLKSQLPLEAHHNLLHGDFFEHTDTYDLILEQTFFCALNPELRPAYASKIQELLKSGGKLSGVLFDFPLTEKGPPFGGSKSEYLQHFDPIFTVSKMERCYNSIKPRAGKELFFELIKA
jgi:hypothetical protein